MKRTLLLLALAAFMLSGCAKDSDDLSLLPQETQEEVLTKADDTPYLTPVHTGTYTYGNRYKFKINVTFAYYTFRRIEVSFGDGFPPVESQLYTDTSGAFVEILLPFPGTTYEIKFELINRYGLPMVQGTPYRVSTAPLAPVLTKTTKGKANPDGSVSFYYEYNITNLSEYNRYCPEMDVAGFWKGPNAYGTYTLIGKNKLQMKYHNLYNDLRVNAFVKSDLPGDPIMGSGYILTGQVMSWY